MDFLSTSSVACHSAALRYVREIAKTGASDLHILHDAVMPVWLEIRNRGKLSRSSLNPSFQGILDRILKARGIVDVLTSIRTPNLALLGAKEACNARLILIMSEPDGGDHDRMLDFVSVELLLDCRVITMRIDIADFTATSHVLARFR